MTIIRLHRRTIPGRLLYLSGKLLEGEQHRESVAVALSAFAADLDGGMYTKAQTWRVFCAGAAIGVILAALAIYLIGRAI